MTEEKTPKSKALKIFENILFILCLGIIVLRVRITEIPLPQSSDNFLYHSSAPYSLVISIIIIAAFLLWLTFRILTGRFIYRKSLIEIGLILLVIASCISCLAASNSRAAITNTVIFIAPVVMAILLIQILDCDLKIKLTLAVIAAAGFLNAFQSADQYFKGNDEVIELYKQNPQQILNYYGIEPGSIDQFMLEHRLLSKNIVGYFTTSNSSGSFLILAFFAAGLLLIEKIRNRKLPDADDRFIFSCGIVVLVILISLFLTRSKGAIAAFILAVLLFALLWLFGKHLYIQRRKIFIIAILLTAIVAVTSLFLSLSNRPLPGGNSMLIRQQYWQAAVQAYKNNPLTGIGAGNFADFYFRYKLPQSLETISDSHNFILSILLQYGPLGLIAFLVIIFIPIWRIIFAQTLQVPAFEKQGETKLNKIVIGAFLFAVLMLVRPAAGSLLSQGSAQEQIAVFIYIFFIPAFAFLLGFLLLTSGPQSTILNRQAAYPASTIVGMFCALAGVLVHNFIDIAIFEPSILTAFFAIFACLVSSDFNYRRQQVFYKPIWAVKLLTAAASVIVFLALFFFALLPVYKSVNEVAAAKQFADIGRFDWTHPLLERAAKDDPLSPLAPSMNGRFYMINYAQQREKTDLLLKAQDCFLKAIKRNKASYKDYEKLSNVYLLLAQTTDEKTQKTQWLNKTFAMAEQAVSLYPSSDRLRFYFAQVCEMQGKKESALENYKKAVEYEDAFREQFKKLYPDNQFFSRLGIDRYNIAKQKIDQLSKEANGEGTRVQ